MIKKILANKVLSIVIAVAVLGAAYWIYGALFPAASTTPQYVTQKVARGAIVVSVTGSGQISASNQISIQSQGAGTVNRVLVSNNQSVAPRQLLVEIDSTSDARAVRNAKASLESAQLSLQKLETPATTSSILQARSSVAQSEQSLANAQNNLATDYNGAYTDISNTFIDLATVMSGMNNVLYGTYLNKSQGDIDSYTNLIANYYPGVTQYNQDAATNYQAALTAYNRNLSDYKNTSVYSSTSSIESLLDETYATLKAISASNASAKNLLDLVSTVLQQNEQKAPSQLATDEANMQSYITATNSHLSTLLQITNALQTDKTSITSAGLSIGQSQAALDQLLNGPTELDVQAQQLSVTQAQNALADAEENLSYDSVRAPFAGIITNITAKGGPTRRLGNDHRDTFEQPATRPGNVQ